MRIIQTMVSGIPLVLGLGTRRYLEVHGTEELLVNGLTTVPVVEVACTKSLRGTASRVTSPVISSYQVPGTSQ